MNLPYVLTPTEDVMHAEVCTPAWTRRSVNLGHVRNSQTYCWHGECRKVSEDDLTFLTVRHRVAILIDNFDDRPILPKMKSGLLFAIDAKIGQILGIAVKIESRRAPCFFD